MTLSEAYTRFARWGPAMRKLVPVDATYQPEPMGCPHGFRQRFDLFPLMACAMCSLSERLYDAVTDADLALGLSNYLEMCRRISSEAFERETRRMWRLVGGPTEKN